MGNGRFILGEDGRAVPFAGDDFLAVPPKTLCGTSTDIGMIYTEIILKKENTIMNNIIKAGQPTALKDLISYEEGSIANVDLIHADNMKFMLNGAITLGTLDGANVEIADAAGKENELIFGMLTPEVNNLKQVGYHPNAFIMGDDVANSALNFLERGWNGENFHEVTENLRSSDPYMVMADFKDYRRAQADLQKLYGDREKWAQMSLKNTANSGIFSADRAVLDYARDIWYASPVPMGK